MLPAEQDRADIARKRCRGKTHQHRVDPQRLVFLDETWVKTNMAPLRGWGPKGKRLAASVPYGHWMTMTFIAALPSPPCHRRPAIAALRCDRVEAPCALDGPMNGMPFTAYVEQFLAPTLARGDIVILDNLGSHKGKAARAAIRRAGAHLLFLPPPASAGGRLYSPDLNPIEQLFAKLKHLMRKAEERTHPAAWRRVGALLDLVSSTECANYLANSGYAAA